MYIYIPQPAEAGLPMMPMTEYEEKQCEGETTDNGTGDAMQP